MGNEFTANNALKGLIYVEMHADAFDKDQPLLLYKNTFSSNAAYFSTIGAHIRLRGRDLDTIVTSDADGTVCSGVKLKDNSF